MRAQAVLFTAVLVIALLDQLKHRFAVFALLALPSTLAHETTHFVVALLLGGKPSGMQLWPTRQGNHYALGHVTVRNSTWFNLGPISLAPLLLIPLAWYLLRYVPAKPSWWEVLMWGALLGSLLYGSLPSGADWRLAFRAPIGSALVVLILAGALWLVLTPSVGRKLGIAVLQVFTDPIAQGTALVPQVQHFAMSHSSGVAVFHWSATSLTTSISHSLAS
jgi:hypothetical protein